MFAFTTPRSAPTFFVVKANTSKHRKLSSFSEGTPSSCCLKAARLPSQKTWSTFEGSRLGDNESEKTAATGEETPLPLSQDLLPSAELSKGLSVISRSASLQQEVTTASSCDDDVSSDRTTHTFVDQSTACTSPERKASAKASDDWIARDFDDSGAPNEKPTNDRCLETVAKR